MNRKIPGFAGLALVACLATAPGASAHHSTAMFKWGEEVAMPGAVVQRWEWTNPHTFIYVVGKGPDGVEKRWALEGMSPSHLARAGWSKRSLKPGDRVDLTFYPLRDGRAGGFNVAVKLPDGTSLRQLPGR
jgi:hypothetical protein